ncbi:MAG: hypothetical protein JWM80_5471 [Cyanobacteria bacterium RYN_339]|nr:hypothetical protein [Cyanobacteria bacterium RYN_339]
MSSISNVRIAPTVRPTAAKPVVKAAPAAPAKAPTTTSSKVAQGIGAAAGLGYFAFVFKMLDALSPAAAVIVVPGLLVGAIGGSRLGKWAADGFKAHVNVGAVVGGLAIGAAYAMGGAGLLVAAAEGGGLLGGLATLLPGVALAAVAGAAAGGAAQNGLGKLFSKKN